MSGDGNRMASWLTASPEPDLAPGSRFLAGIARLLARKLPDLDWCWAHHRYAETCGCSTREQVTR